MLTMAMPFGGCRSNWPSRHGLILTGIAGLNDVRHCIPVGAGIQAQCIKFWPFISYQLLLPMLRQMLSANDPADQMHEKCCLVIAGPFEAFGGRQSSQLHG